MDTRNQGAAHAPPHQYILGHSAQELERLSAQAKFYEPFTLEFFRAAGIEAGMRVLDVGCGAGDVSLLVAQMVGPTGQVVGFDRVPAAVETAKRRALDLGAQNIRFLEADVTEIASEEPFDAAVGRLVLQFSRDPSAMLSTIAQQVRPGGLIAFQEIDWSGCRALPPVPTLSRCLSWGTEVMERSGADVYMGLKLYSTFTAAGLPSPSLSVQAPIGAGPDHPAYTWMEGVMRTLLPSLEAWGVATAEEVDVETLASRIGAEAKAVGATIVWHALVGAFTQKVAN